MLCCIVLGMGVPTTANYCIMASTCAPILIQLGFPVVAAHFFVFYFGIVADITPPVALAAYAGSAIAKSNPMKTGINATKLAIAAFIVPYIFAYSPALLFENISGWWEVAQITVSALLGIFAIAASLNGFLYKKIHWVLRLVLAIGGLKEKSMAAFREGISTVLIPRDNASDLYEVDAEVKEKVRFIPVRPSDSGPKHALVRPGRTPARAVRGVPQATSLIANDKPAEGHKEPAAVM